MPKQLIQLKLVQELLHPDELTIEEGDIVSWVSEGGTHDVNFNINSITNETFGNPFEIVDASLPVQCW